VAVPGGHGVSDESNLPVSSPHGEWVAFVQAGRLKKAPLSGGDPSIIGDDAGDAPTGAWGPDGTILFSPTWAGAGLWRVDAAGGTPVQVTTPAADRGETGHFWPSFLPGGTSALFTIFGGRGLSDSKVGVLDLASGRIEVLFDGARPRYLASGHVLFYRGGDHHLVPFDPRGPRTTGDPVRVLGAAIREPALGASSSFVSVSDTGVLAYVPGVSTPEATPSRFAWIARDGSVEPLGFEGNHRGEFSLSPDGRSVAVSRFAAGEYQIWHYDLERGTAQQLTRDGPELHPVVAPRWTKPRHHVADRRIVRRASPAGGRLVPPAPPSGHGRRGGDLALGARRLVGGVRGVVDDGNRWVSPKGDPAEARPLVATSVNEDEPRISPDGRWLAYQSGADLYVSPYPAVDSRVIIQTKAQMPRWSPRGPELFFIREGTLRVVGYAVSSGVVRTGRPSTLFAIPRGFIYDGFEVSPDARRFLFRVPLEGASAPSGIRVVVDGFAELARESGRGR
jgi:hypothetical protein